MDKYKITMLERMSYEKGLEDCVEIVNEFECNDCSIPCGKYCSTQKLIQRIQEKKNGLSKINEGGE